MAADADDLSELAHLCHFVQQAKADYDCPLGASEKPIDRCFWRLFGGDLHMLARVARALSALVLPTNADGTECLGRAMAYLELSSDLADQLAELVVAFNETPRGQELRLSYPLEDTILLIDESL